METILNKESRAAIELMIADGIVSQEVAERYFPELKEGEDEKIRKSIISGMTALKEQGKKTFATIPINDCIAWLEKQGKLIAELQKTYAEIGRLVKENYYLKEKQGEQKPADNLEPKFKVGDWVVYNRNDHSREIMQIYDIKDGRYYFTDNVHFSWSIKECDEKSHFWSIEDAKDGDVLYCKSDCGIEYIVMNKGVNEHGCIDSYFRYNSVNGFGIDIPNVLSTRQDDITPATQEQRNLLFQKMHEAGYVWDAEKKELKKIEQKPAEWSEKDKQMYEGLMFDLQKLEGLSDFPISNNSYNWLKSLKNRVKPLPKQKWSEEDERKLQLLIVMCDETKGDSATYSTIYREMEELKTWLKSLKERYTWKPSDGQINELHRVISGCSYDIEPLVELEENLRKLKA